MAYEGYQQQPAGIVIANDNPKAWIVVDNQVLGGSHVYPYLIKPSGQTDPGLLDVHPGRMKRNMMAVVGEHTTDDGQLVGRKLYYLKQVPQESDIPLSLTKSDTNYFLNFWHEGESYDFEGTPEYNYAPNFTNGGKPPYPYADDSGDANWVWEQANWVTTYDPVKRHEWVRIRVSGGQWSPPFPFNSILTEGEYVDRRFIRVSSGTTPLLPPTYLSDGTLNNEPSGWSPDPVLWSSGTDHFEIRGLKSKYGQLTSDWLGPFKIDERPSYTRYSSSPTPDPNTIVGVGTAITTGDANDLALDAAGWTKFPTEDSAYIATREDDNGANPGPPFTNWIVRRVSNEEGEYVDFRFKLFDFNVDYDDPTWRSNNTPTGQEPEGWFDSPVPVEPNSTKINFVVRGIKYSDGELKTPWSSPVPWGSKDSFDDTIKVEEWDGSGWVESTPTFKFDKNLNVSPSQLRLSAEIYLGQTAYYDTADVAISYQWYKIYDNGSIVSPLTQIVTQDTNQDVYVSGSETMTSGQSVTGRRLVVKPDGITGKAIFKCTMTVTLPGSPDLVFNEEVTIIDVSDGLDAKIVVLTGTNQIFSKLTEEKTTGTVVTTRPDTITVRVITQNLTQALNASYWEKKNEAAGTWSQLSTDANYTVSSDNVLINKSAINASPFTTSYKRIVLRYNHPEAGAAEEFSVYLNEATVKDGAADKYKTTSTTSLTIGTGTQNLTVEANLAYTPQQTVKIVSTANVANYMVGTVTSYNGSTGAMVVDVTSVGGSGTVADWTVNLDGAVGEAGDKYKTSSSTSVDLSAISVNDTVSMVVESGLAWTNGQKGIITSNASPNTNYFLGTVSSYNKTTGDIDFTANNIFGSGAHTDWTVNVSGDSITGPQGEAGFTVILTNESDQILTDENGVVKSGETHPSDYTQSATKTRVRIFKGVTELDNFAISVNSQTPATGSGVGNVAVGVVNAANNKWAYIQHWGDNVEKAEITLSINYNSSEYVTTKVFTVGRIKDPSGGLIAVIESTGANNKGFRFTNSNRNDITLAAKLYNASTRAEVVSGLTYSWTKTEGGGTLLGTPLTTSTITVQRSQITSYAIVRAQITYDGVNYAAAARIEDILDNSPYRAYTPANYSQAIMNTLKIPATVGIVAGQFHNLSSDTAIGATYTATNSGNTAVWYLTPQGSDKWIIDGIESSTKINSKYNQINWYNPVKVGGEQGSQGFHGGNVVTLYSYNNTFPAAGQGSATITQMVSHGWSKSLPSVTSNVYSTTASFYTGTTLPPNDSTVPESPGWSTPVIIAQPAQPGTPGSDAPGGAIYATEVNLAVPGNTNIGGGIKFNFGVVSKTDLRGVVVYVKHSGTITNGWFAWENDDNPTNLQLRSMPSFTDPTWSVVYISVDTLIEIGDNIFTMYASGASSAVVTNVIVHAIHVDPNRIIRTIIPGTSNPVVTLRNIINNHIVVNNGTGDVTLNIAHPGFVLFNNNSDDIILKSNVPFISEDGSSIPGSTGISIKGDTRTILFKDTDNFIYPFHGEGSKNDFQFIAVSSNYVLNSKKDLILFITGSSVATIDFGNDCKTGQRIKIVNRKFNKTNATVRVIGGSVISTKLDAIGITQFTLEYGSTIDLLVTGQSQAGSEYLITDISHEYDTKRLRRSFSNHNAITLAGTYSVASLSGSSWVTKGTLQITNDFNTVKTFDVEGFVGTAADGTGNIQVQLIVTVTESGNPVVGTQIAVRNYQTQGWYNATFDNYLDPATAKGHIDLAPRTSVTVAIQSRSKSGSDWFANNGYIVANIMDN